MNQDLKHPLQWPIGAKRTPPSQRRAARFNGRVNACTIASQLRELGEELRRVGAAEWLVSSNLRMRQDGLPYSQQNRPEDPGIAVYFRLKGKDHSLACDRWLTCEHNLRAIVLHIAALRGQDRWGVGTLEQAFAGYAQLPAPAGRGRHWTAVLGLMPDAHPSRIKDRWRELVKLHHPDAGGKPEDFKEIQTAWEQAVLELGIKA